MEKKIALQINSSYLNVVFNSRVWIFAQALREALSLKCMLGDAVVERETIFKSKLSLARFYSVRHEN